MDPSFETGSAVSLARATSPVPIEVVQINSNYSDKTAFEVLVFGEA